MTPTELDKAASVLRHYNTLIMALKDYNKDKCLPSKTLFSFYGWPVMIDTVSFADLAEEQLNKYYAQLLHMGIRLDPAELREVVQVQNDAAR
jgi:hypothetical protein